VPDDEVRLLHSATQIALIELATPMSTNTPIAINAITSKSQMISRIQTTTKMSISYIHFEVKNNIVIAKIDARIYPRKA